MTQRKSHGGWQILTLQGLSAHAWLKREGLSFSRCCCDVRGDPRSPAFLWEEQLLNDVISSWVAVTLVTCGNT